MQNVTFLEICKTLDILEKTSSRNEMTEKLSSLYQTLNVEDSQILSYLMLGRVAPFFVNSEFNYSEKSIITLLSKILKLKDIKENISNKRKELGDIGETVEHFSTIMNHKSESITLNEIYQILWKIVKTSGTGSVDIKNQIISETLKKLSPLEAKYFSRVVCGSLRLGINSKTLLDVFSHIMQQDKGMRKELDRAYGAYADIGYICSLIKGNSLEKIQENLKKVKIQPGVPVMSRLVERVGTFQEAFHRLDKPFLVQSKYDGLRCQIHKFRKDDSNSKFGIWQKYIEIEGNANLFEDPEDGFQIKLYTRNLEDITEMFPEIVQEAKSLKYESFILDSEVLGWNKEKSKFLTFQETMQRRRKYEVGDMRNKIPVKAMTFDILYLKGEDLSSKDTGERIEILKDFDTQGSIDKDRSVTISSMEELNEIFNKNIDLGHEGIIIKNLKGSYLPGVRNYEWIKLKKSMNGKVVDTIDLVAVGYSYGSGRRNKLGIGAVLGALYNEKENVFEAICNVGTGFSDSLFKEISSSLEGDILSDKPNNVLVQKGLEPNVWIEPRVVFTVEADEITKKKGGSSLSLRFPRLVEWGRDKDITEATTVDELERMYGGKSG